jgi:hypothetical protein
MFIGRDGQWSMGSFVCDANCGLASVIIEALVEDDQFSQVGLWEVVDG